MNADVRNSNGVIYSLDDKPPPLRTVTLSIQHVLTMFGSTVAVPLIFGPLLWPVDQSLPSELVANLTNIQLTNTALLISSVMLCSGIATLLQSTFGSRLPIIQGVSFSFLAAFFGIVASVQATEGPDWSLVISGGASTQSVAEMVDRWQACGAMGMRTIAGAIILGGVLEAFVGFSGAMGQIRKILSPVVIGPVIMLIGLALYQVGAPVAGVFPARSPGYLDLSAVERSPWVRSGDLLLPWGAPEFAISATVAVLAGYLASMIESFGDYHACKQMAGGKFGACAAAIPKPVVGGLYCVLFGLISAVGVRQFAKADLTSDRNLLIGGFSLFMGLSVPFYFSSFSTGPTDVQWMPQSFQGLVIALGSTGMAVAAVIGLILDNCIPGTRRERGLETHDPSVLVPQVGDVDVEGDEAGDDK